MNLRFRILFSILSGLLAGAVLAVIFPMGQFWIGWLSGALLFGLCAFGLLSAWQVFGGGKLLAWLIVAAFLLRLVLGVLLTLGLPVFGYPEPEQKAGYLFYDAFKRDNEAWGLVFNKAPLLPSLFQNFDTDQYGGLLSLSGLIYRTISPDAHRSYLILILTAFMAALGVVFFYRAAKIRWGPVVASFAAWVMVLYPDSLLLGASQMREPFLIGLICIAFWGVACWPKPSRWASAVAVFGSLALMSAFSLKIMPLAAGVLGVWFFLDRYYDHITGYWKWAVWAGFVLAGLAVLGVTWRWFVESVAWDIELMTRVSSMSESAIKEIGAAFRPVYYTIYGLARPLLPAAIATTRPPWIWKTIDVSRAAGWYLLAPFLLYSFLGIFKEKDRAARRTLLWFAVAIAAWLVISSARAGGDQWDNPRYRTIFLPWLALLAGWAFAHRGAWLWRILAVEGIFLTFFTQWYLARYWTWLGWQRMAFWAYPVLVIALSGFILVGGWLWDRRSARLISNRPAV